MRRLLSVLLVLGACSVLGCDFRDSEAFTINQKIRLAQEEMERDGATQRKFKHVAKTERPYVLAILPTEGVTKATITSLDVPREAKAWLTSELDNRSLDGPLLGILEANKAEWVPLPEGVSARELVHVWKQPGEELTVEMTVAGGRTLVRSLQ
jgi:hypothetical protein